MADHDQNGGGEPWERRALFAFGALFLVALIAVVYFVPNPSRQEWYVLLCTLGLAAGAIAALLPGSIDWSVKPGLRVTGALAVAALVVWLGKSFAPGDSAETEPRRVTASMAFEKCATSPDNIQRTDVYVAVDGKLVLADIRNPDAPLPAATSAPASSVKCSAPQRGQGGIIIDCGPIPIGANLTVFVRGIQSQNQGERWWKTYDLRVPAMYADMDDGSKDDFAYLLQQR
jgi:hypothetical protein